jgi:hypothetical protein
MGMYATAVVAYGIDLGDDEYGESYVEVPKEYLEDSLYEGLEKAFDEYRVLKAGPKPAYPWETGGDREAWDKWRNSIGGVGYTTYGYEHSGVMLTAAGGRAADYEPKPIDIGEVSDADLEEFVQFLESKGFKFNPDKRKAQWLVAAAYG